MTDLLAIPASVASADARWVSATSLRQFVLDDPLVDWLDWYGAGHGYVRDDRLPSYDPRTDFLRFLLAKGREFEAGVVRCLGELAFVTEVTAERRPSPNPAAAEETLVRMRAGEELIYRGVLVDEATRTFGEPDLLVRSDVLARLFPDTLPADEIEFGAPGLGASNWHYRVVDVKLSTLRLSGRGELRAEGSAAAYRAQIFVYNRALAAAQGFEPPAGYVLGRNWEQETRGEVSRGTGCLERLGSVSQSDERLAARVEASTEWVRRVRGEGKDWEALPVPSIPELWPNLAHRQDAPWHQAKRQIGEALGELTQVWGVGFGKRVAAHEAGVYSWQDPRCTPTMLGITGEMRVQTTEALLEVNRRVGGSPVAPARVHAGEDVWRPVPELEFYVDFEAVSDLNDDFTLLPLRGGQPMIFMIGSGHIENDEWTFTSFVANELTEAAEADTIEAWFAHMADVRARLAPGGADPLVIHWSPAEESTLERAYNSAARRHPDRIWPSPRWFDFLSRVVRAEPVVVRGALSFGLKAFARALCAEGCIQTGWDDGMGDGLGAAVGAWWCEAEASRLGVSIRDVPLMEEIARYNEVDCKVMMEIVHYLREEH